jgi:hypothetical protein
LIFAFLAAAMRISGPSGILIPLIVQKEKYFDISALLENTDGKPFNSHIRY